MAAKPSKPSGGRVTPKGTGSASGSTASGKKKSTNIVAIILIVLVLAGLVAGTIGSMVGTGGTTTTSIPVTSLPG